VRKVQFCAIFCRVFCVERSQVHYSILWFWFKAGATGEPNRAAPYRRSGLD
jgi:hypothetical protein